MDYVLLGLGLFAGFACGFLFGLLLGYWRLARHLADHPESKWWDVIWRRRGAKW
jgi:hypothetical protein